MDSHSELDEMNKKLVAEIEHLRSRTVSPKPSEYDEAD